MNIIKWDSSTLSGLGDRLVDLTLMTSYSRVKNCHQHLNWHTINGNGHLWGDNRFNDYKIL
jgi:hypothetical protein